MSKERAKLLEKAYKNGYVDLQSKETLQKRIDGKQSVKEEKLDSEIRELLYEREMLKASVWPIKLT